MRCGGSKEVSGLMNPVVARLRKFLEESTLNVFIREVRGLKLFFFYFMNLEWLGSLNVMTMPVCRP